MRAPGISIAAAALLLTAADLHAQSLASRVDEVRDGKVRFSFAAKEGVCGNGRSSYTVYTVRSDRDWEPWCEEGPVRVQIDRSGGRSVELDTYVGGRWRDPGSRPVIDLGQVSATAATGYLLRLAKSEGSGIGRGALGAAALADSVTIWPDLREVAFDENLPVKTREAAVFWLSQVPQPEALDAIEEVLDRATDKDLREKAVFALSQHPAEDAARRLETLARDQDEPVWLREKAIFWLGQSRQPEGFQILSAIFSEARDHRLQEKIVFSISQLNDEVASNWLLQVARDEGTSREVRAKAIFWAGQSGVSTERLVDLYRALSAGELKERLIFALSQRNDEAAIEALIDIAQNDPSRERRKKAWFWLGQSDHPAAVEAIVEALEG